MVGLGKILLACLLALVALLGAWSAHAETPIPAQDGPSDVVVPKLQPEAAPPSEGAADPAPLKEPSGRSMRKGRPGGVNPCMTPDPGFGIYDNWSRNISIGQLLAPESGGITKSGSFDLVVHFHGHYPIRKEFVKTAKGIVLVAVDLGVSSAPYTSAFSSPQVFERLLDSVEKEMARRSGKDKARVRKLALSSWSAGYGAIQQILQQPAGKKVDAVILLDSLHAGYANPSAKTLKEEQLKPFLAFAREAIRGRKFLFQSHSSIIPPGYASTREVSNFMVDELGGKMRKSSRSDVLGLKMFERYDRGNYHVRGYRGEDKPDHCAHLGLMKDIIKVHINPRWRSPVGKRGKRAIAAAKQQAKKSGTIHVVESGEHLTGIAKQYGTTVSAIRDANDLVKGKPIRIGQELIIPAQKAKRGSKRADDERPRPGEKVHVVASGQSLGRIAKRYHVTVDAIRERNGIEVGGRKIQPGDRLFIPAKKKN